MSYPAGEPYVPQTEDEEVNFARSDSHPADLQGAIDAEVAAQSGHPLADSVTEVTREHLTEGVDLYDDDEDEDEERTTQNADSRRAGWIRQNDASPHSFGRAEP